MALTKCPECGQEISDTAKSCPHCGYKIKKVTNLKQFDKKKIMMPIILVVLVSIIVIFFSVFSGDKVIRNARWGESLNSIAKREQSNTAESNLSVTDKKIYVSQVSMYGQGGGKLWYKFDEHSKLNEILVRFDCYKDDDFSSLAQELEKGYGTPVTTKDRYISWSKKGTFITLERDTSHYSMDITFSKQ